MNVTSAPEAKMIEAVIDDAMIASMQARAGTDLRIDHSVNNEEATRIAIAKFADGIGDANPLWRDQDAATASDYGGPVAPPAFVIGCFSGIQFGWPGLGSFHSSTDMVLHKPVYLSDTVNATCRYDGFTGPRPSSFAGQAVTDQFINTYTNQLGEEVATINWEVVNYERGVAKSTSKKRDPIEVPHPWTDEDAAAVEAHALSEAPRGAEPRYWEDVQIREKIQTLTKGPIGLTDEVAFIAGGGTPIPRLKAHRAALLDYDKHPAWAFRDPVTRSLEPIYAVHYNSAAARAMGVTFSYDVGFQRQCWQIQLMSNWVGDNGWVWKLSAQYRGFVYLSDVVTLGGEIVAKEIIDDEHTVTVKTFARNQRGQDVMPGTATVILPTRDGDASPVARRARTQ